MSLGKNMQGQDKEHEQLCPCPCAPEAVAALLPCVPLPEGSRRCPTIGGLQFCLIANQLWGFLCACSRRCAEGCGSRAPGTPTFTSSGEPRQGGPLLPMLPLVGMLSEIALNFGPGHVLPYALKQG